jgi:hypothetical protein
VLAGADRRLARRRLDPAPLWSLIGGPFEGRYRNASSSAIIIASPRPGRGRTSIACSMRRCAAAARHDPGQDHVLFGLPVRAAVAVAEEGWTRRRRRGSCRTRRRRALLPTPRQSTSRTSTSTRSRRWPTPAMPTA